MANDRDQTCYQPLMIDNHQDDDFTPQEAQERFERALRAGLNMPPVKRPEKKQPQNANVARKTTRQLHKDSDKRR